MVAKRKNLEMKQMRTLTLVACGMALLSLTATSQEAEDFTILDVAGTARHLYAESDAGNTVGLQFFTSWCLVCNVAAPQIQTRWESYQSGGSPVVYWAVNRAQNEYNADAIAYRNLHSLTYPVIGEANSIAQLYPNQTAFRFFVLSFFSLSALKNETVTKAMLDFFALLKKKITRAKIPEDLFRVFGKLFGLGIYGVIYQPEYYIICLDRSYTMKTSYTQVDAEVEECLVATLIADEQLLQPIVSIHNGPLLGNQMQASSTHCLPYQRTCNHAA